MPFVLMALDCKMEIRYDLLRLGTFVQRALGCKMEIRDDL